MSSAPLPAEPFHATSLSASLTVAHLPMSVAWYQDVLGFVVEREHVREGQVRAVSLAAGTVRILLTQDNWAKGTDRHKGVGFSLQFTTTQDVYTLAARIRAAGMAFETEPTEMRGVRVFRVRDLDGFLLVISAERQSAE
jgi:uncharacterized glyoxalase superfamily protein PhnB